MIQDSFAFSEKMEHNPKDPNPWQAMYLDQSIPLRASVKEKWLKDSSSNSRQYILPFVRPLARVFIMLIQVVKALSPIDWRASKVLHKLIVWGLKTFVSPEANVLILRHFHAGSEILAFVAANVPGIQIPLNPLKPKNLDALADDMFLIHDLNLYNFIINLNKEMQQKGLQIKQIESPDFSMITDGEFEIEVPKRGWLNFIDLQTAIELYTPIFQLFLTDNDFWRAVNSLQLDETIGIYAATILNSHNHLILVNNKHPLVPMVTLQAGYRLVLHGLSTEMGHWFLVLKKLEQIKKKSLLPPQSERVNN